MLMYVNVTSTVTSNIWKRKGQTAETDACWLRWNTFPWFSILHEVNK